MGHFIKQSKFVICSSLFERLPSDFLTKGTKINTSWGSCCYSSGFILNFIKFVFLVL